MIFLDTNFFLRYLVQPTTPASCALQTVAVALFDAVERGDEVVTTCEVVLHEVCYVLASKAHYAQTAEEIASYLAPILRMKGFKLPRGEKRVYTRALEIYAAHPKLGFADALIAARAEALGVPLATFDEALARLPFLTRWRAK
ncbi:MAG: type II toxin-antitoxin system VapC family toxin [Chloroflexota bacterium]|nr:type II toxin-antitoxin system VapC family toxin [Chloroflexota bacterium]